MFFFVVLVLCVASGIGASACLKRKQDEAEETQH
jgi:hypothetical protein